MTTYALEYAPLMIHKSVLVDARIVIHIFVVVTNKSQQRAQS
jgi:hypothetical protein